MSEQLKTLVAQFRQERDVGLKKTNVIDEPSLTPLCNDMELIERIRRGRVVGQKKILLRLDEKHASLLEQIKPVLGLDVTHFVNYIISDFLEAHPQLKQQISNSLKNV